MELLICEFTEDTVLRGLLSDWVVAREGWDSLDESKGLDAIDRFYKVDHDLKQYASRVGQNMEVYDLCDSIMTDSLVGTGGVCLW